jgi:fructuronate reductase
MHRLNRETLARLPLAVRRPDYDFKNVGVGIVHLGLGAFHRAHQSMFTEDALSAGGDWGILGVSLRHPAASEALAAQDHLHTVGIFPLMIANAGSGAPIRSLARIVRGWLESVYGETHVQSALDDPMLFPLPIRENASLRAAILEAVA